MAHRRFHRAASGAKGSLIGAASGAGTAALAGYAQTAIPFLQSGGWWAMPTTLFLVGHFLKRKNPTIGGAIIGIAGYQAYGNFLAAKSAKGFVDAGDLDAGALVTDGSTRYTDSAFTTASLGTASGRNNAGMLVNHEVMGYGDAGELVDAMGLES